MNLAATTDDCSAGFMIDRVAGHEGGRGHAAEDGQREVPRGDDDAHAARLVEVFVVFAGHVAARGERPGASSRGRRSRRNRWPRRGRRRPRATACRTRRPPRRPARSAAGAARRPRRADSGPAVPARCRARRGRRGRRRRRPAGHARASALPQRPTIWRLCEGLSESSKAGVGTGLLSITRGNVLPSCLPTCSRAVRMARRDSSRLKSVIGSMVGGEASWHGSVCRSSRKGSGLRMREGPGASLRSGSDVVASTGASRLGRGKSSGASLESSTRNPPRDAPPSLTHSSAVRIGDRRKRVSVPPSASIGRTQAALSSERTGTRRLPQAALSSRFAPFSRGNAR